MEFTGFTFEHTFTNVSSETLEIFFHRVSDRYGVSFLKYGGNFPSSQMLVIPKNILLRNVFWSLWNRWITQRELVWNRCYLCTIQTVVFLNWMIYDWKGALYRLLNTLEMSRWKFISYGENIAVHAGEFPAFPSAKKTLFSTLQKVEKRWKNFHFFHLQWYKSGNCHLFSTWSFTKSGKKFFKNGNFHFFHL